MSKSTNLLISKITNQQKEPIFKKLSNVKLCIILYLVDFIH